MSSIQPNSPLQSANAINPYAPKKPEGVLGQASAVGTAVFRPLHDAGRWLRAKVKPSPNPQEALAKIGENAQVGLQRATVRGVRVETEIETAQRLYNTASAVATNTRNASAVGAVADISPLPMDPQVTAAPNLQARVDATDWKVQMAFHRDRLIQKTSAFAVLWQMRERCIINEDSRNPAVINNKDSLPLMNIVKRFTEDNVQGKSLWDLFTEQYPALTFMQKIKAGWVYWLYYKSSLITNTIKAYMEPAIENLSAELIKPNSDARNTVFRKLLENINQFLLEDIHATKDFAYERERGDLAEVRDRAIQRNYGFSLPDLCKAFANKRVDQDAPTVPMFRSLQRIPLAGLLFKAFESLVNRFIIRSAMKSSVLPSALQSVVQNGLNATQPHNLPFSIHLTDFLNSRLELLIKSLDGPTSSSTTVESPGTELLVPTIKNLMMVLKLEDFQTSLELRKKFEQIENEWGYHPNKLAENKITDGIVKACHLLFKDLNDPLKVEELFANLLDSSCKPFSGEIISQEVLQAQFAAKKQKMEELARAVCEKIVRKAISETIKIERPEDTHKAADEAFQAGKTATHKALEELNKLCVSMTAKIAQSGEAPTPENNAQQEIALFLQIMKVFANQKEIQQEVEGSNLNATDRDAIWRLMNPIYEKASHIQDRVLRLQELQDSYPAHANVKSQLELINNKFRSIHNEFHAQPRHLQIPLIQTLNKAAEDISICLGSNADVTLITKQHVKRIADLSESIAKKQKAIDAIHAFYPPRLNANDLAAEGLLDQLLNYERGLHAPGFKPRACLEEIGKYLDYLPPQQKRELAALIGNGTRLKSKWNELGTALQKIYEQHLNLKSQDLAELDRALSQATVWIEDKISKYSVLKQNNHQKMMSEIQSISQGVESLRQNLSNAKLNIPSALYRANISGALCSFIGGGIGSVLGPVGTAVGAGAGAIVGEYLYARPSEQNKQEASKKGSPVKRVISGIAGLVGSYYGIPAVAAPGSALAGWNTVKAGETLIGSYVEGKVMDIFTNAHKLCLNPRIYKAATTRIMKELG